MSNLEYIAGISVMRAMCLDCREPDEVAICARPYCPLWPYRDGTSPWKRGDGCQVNR
jgi:hypothetical protein